MAIRISLIWLWAPCVLLSVARNDGGRETGRLSDGEFVAWVVSASRFEIEAGGLAYAKAADNGMMEYGRLLASDRGAMCAELAILADSGGWDLPDGLMASEQRMLTALGGLEGEAFEREFMHSMARHRDDMVALFEWATGPEGVRDDELRHWAATKLQVMQSCFWQAPARTGSITVASAR